ncbi:MAG: hypothetical protein QXD48_01090 [Candidatus Aenigmatarchaeota archaeon]
MKGISLAIETIIFIILGVTVLTVLLFFFTSLGGPTQNEVENQFERNQFCGRYANYDPKCENVDKIIDAKQKEEILKGIGEACKALKVEGCTSIPPSIECIKNCCIHCPK